MFVSYSEGVKVRFSSNQAPKILKKIGVEAILGQKIFIFIEFER